MSTPKRRDPFAKPVISEGKDTNLGIGVWSAGFAALFGFVFLSPVLTVLATLIIRRVANRNGERAIANAQAALNWQLTYLMANIVAIVLHLIVVFGVTGGVMEGPAVVTISLILVPAAANLVVTLVGAIKASEGGVYRAPGTIRFVKDRAPHSLG